jgi:uncharacterized protein HemX
VLQLLGESSRTWAENRMKKTIGLLALAVALGAGGSYAAENKQQSKMTECNAQAVGKKGDERKAFMKECLSAKKETPQQAKMKSCNAEAKDMKGDARKKFMSDCLKK